MRLDRDVPAPETPAGPEGGAAGLSADSLPGAYVAAVLDMAGIPTGAPAA